MMLAFSQTHDPLSKWNKFYSEVSTWHASQHTKFEGIVSVHAEIQATKISFLHTLKKSL